MSSNKEEQDDELLALSEIMDPNDFRHNGKSKLKRTNHKIGLCLPNPSIIIQNYII